LALGCRLAIEGGLPKDDLPKTASGRAERDAADERFLLRQFEVEQDPADWRVWYRLALAYDESRDRKRARGAMRQALSLYSA
jgi:Flp pilus assembly protein TadD